MLMMSVLAPRLCKEIFMKVSKFIPDLSQASTGPVLKGGICFVMHIVFYLC